MEKQNTTTEIFVLKLIFNAYLKEYKRINYTNTKNNKRNRDL